MVAGGCFVFISLCPDRSLLPPLLSLSMANAFTWTPPDHRNPYLWWCLAACVALLVAAAVLPAMGMVLQVGVPLVGAVGRVL